MTSFCYKCGKAQEKNEYMIKTISYNFKRFDSLRFRDFLIAFQLNEKILFLKTKIILKSLGKYSRKVCLAMGATKGGGGGNGGGGT